MAKLAPIVNPDEIDNSGERKIAEVLVEQLPDNILAIHSFKWTNRMTFRPLIEGECDFVVLDPKRGMLFIEVKGGILQYQPDDNEWVRIMPNGDRLLINKDPVEQVRDNMYQIVEYLKKNLGIDELGFTYGYAVAFPDGIFRGKLPAIIQREQILDVPALNDFENAIDRVFNCFHRARNSGLSKQEFSRVKSALLQKYEILPVLCRSIEDQERMLHRVTEDQKRILDVLASQKTAAIEGGAGTGKTLIALAKAQEMARSGLRTLLVCYNKPLKDWLIETTSNEFGDSLTIHNYHSLVHSLCEITGVTFYEGEGPPPQEFWEEIAPELLMRACDRLSSDQKFDAVIVDEGQDFRALWWDSLDSVFHYPQDKACFYVFHDPRQNLYVDDQVELPNELGRSYHLDTNCRNTTKIAEYCASIVGDQVKTLPNSPIGIVPQIHQANDVATGIRRVRKLVRELCMHNKDGLKMSQVVVLAPAKTKDQWQLDFSPVAITKNIGKWRENQGVLITTLYQFKGLEADAVILLTKPLPDTESRLHVENYVACSRAKHILHIVEFSEFQKRDG